MSSKRTISNVGLPGKVVAEAKKDKQGYIGELSLKTPSQLQELLERQLRLLSNKSFISKLEDKGEKIKTFKESIEEELKNRSPNDKLSNMLSAMSLNGKEDLDALEWTGRCTPGYVAPKPDMNLSDDEQDPLKILASHSGAGFHKKEHRVIKAEDPLVKPSDITDLDTGQEEALEEYAKHLCEKIDSVNPHMKAKFLPYKSLNKSAPDVKEPRRAEKGSRWEVTAATPPPIVHGDTKLLSLHESMSLQTEQQHQFKEIQRKRTAERQAAWHEWSETQLPREPGDYRDPGAVTSDEEEGSEAEVHDEDDYPDTGGVVVYSLVDDVVP